MVAVTKNWIAKMNETKNQKMTNMLTTEGRKTLMKQGLCFKCLKRGHRAKDCPPDKENKPYEPKKKENYWRKPFTHSRRKEEKNEEQKDEGQDEVLKKRTGLTSVSPSISIHNVLTAETNNHSMSIPITIGGKKIVKPEPSSTLEQDANSSIRILPDS